MADPGEEILLHFTQFALFEEKTKTRCNDYLEIYDVFHDVKGNERVKFQGFYSFNYKLIFEYLF